MSTKSKSQQKAANMALAAVKGEMDPSDLNGTAEKMYENMSKKDLEELVGSKNKLIQKNVNETFIPSTLEDFLLESDGNRLSTFEDVVLSSMESKGLSRTQADFAISQISDSQLKAMENALEYNEKSIDDIAVEIKNIAFNKVSENINFERTGNTSKTLKVGKYNGPKTFEDVELGDIGTDYAGNEVKIISKMSPGDPGHDRYLREFGYDALDDVDVVIIVAVAYDGDLIPYEYSDAGVLVNW